jgi:hypothetical protein
VNGTCRSVLGVADGFGYSLTIEELPPMTDVMVVVVPVDGMRDGGHIAGSDVLLIRIRYGASQLSEY